MTWTWFDLEGAFNVRDLGGLPTDDGLTKAGVLMRSDALDQLTAADVDQLHQGWGLAHVVDLRSASERAARGRGLLGDTGVRYTELEVIGPDDIARRAEGRLAAFAAGKPGAEIMADGYVELLELGGSAFAEAFERIVEPGGTPALIHCAAGKDRTGVLVALLLDVAGVDRETIYNDYAATGDRMMGIVERLGAAASYEQITSQYPAFVFQAVAETMERLLAYVDTTWGGGAGFFTAHGVSPDRLDRWRDLIIAA